MRKEERAFSRAQNSILEERTRLMTSTRDELDRLLQVALQRIQIILAGAPSDYQQWHLDQLQQQISQVLAELGDAGASVMASATRDAWSVGESFILDPFGAAGIALQLPMLDGQLLTAIRSFQTERIRDISVQALSKINQELGLTMIGAQGIHETITRVSSVLGEDSRTRAMTIVRSGLGTAFAVSGQRRLEQANLLVAMDKVWRRSGKIHSRLNHDLADGQRVAADKPFTIQTAGGPIKMMHPHDPAAPAGEVINCGCVSVPKVRDWGATMADRKPYSRQEIRLNPNKAQIAEGQTLQQLLEKRKTS